MKFYFCKYCGNLVEMIEDSGANPICCSRDMQELVPCSTDGAIEKHVPVVKVTRMNGDCDNLARVSVNIGESDHPMTAEHYIKWIELETKCCIMRHRLSPDDAPHADFYINCSDEVVAVYEYCNIHGLWEAKKNEND